MNLNILEIGISLVFIYSLMALLVSTVIEIINTTFNLRGKYLKNGLGIFLNASGKYIEKNNLLNRFLDTPTVNTLKTKGVFSTLNSGKLKLPSFIPADSVYMSLMQTLNPENKEITSEALPKLFDENELLNSNPEFKKILQGLWNNANGRIDEFKLGLEKSYNETMDRVSGWFKRRVQIVNFCICIVVVLLLNIDTINIIRTLSRDNEVRENLVNLATAYMQNHQSDSLNMVSNSGTNDTIIQIQTKTNQINADLIKLKSTGLPLGWNLKDDFRENANIVITSIAENFSKSIFGWIITILAIYLGAPFWFEMLNKLVSLRSTGKKPKKENKDNE